MENKQFDNDCDPKRSDDFFLSELNEPFRQLERELQQEQILQQQQLQDFLLLQQKRDENNACWQEYEAKCNIAK